MYMCIDLLFYMFHSITMNFYVLTLSRYVWRDHQVRYSNIILNKLTNTVHKQTNESN